MKKLYTLLFLAVATLSVNAQTVAQWNFDAATPEAALSPTTGSGTLTLIGGVVDNLTDGAMPAGNPSTGKAYSIKTFPEQGVASGTAGYQFAVSTVGVSSVSVSFDPRSSNTGSKWQQYEYSADGTTWNVVSNNAGTLVNAFSPLPTTVLLPADAGNSANFKFRIVSIFEPGTSAYAAVGATSTYAPGGAWRLDNFTVSNASLSTKQNSISGLKVYPNPVTNGILNISSDNTTSKQVTIVDVLGKQVLNTTVSNQPINVANLKTGVYIVKITEEGKTATRKLVIK